MSIRRDLAYVRPNMRALKKKELVGSFANKGKEWQPKHHPERVEVHDFADPDVGKAVPYGVYDLGRTRAGMPRGRFWPGFPGLGMCTRRSGAGR